MNNRLSRRARLRFSRGLLASLPSGGRTGQEIFYVKTIELPSFIPFIL